MTEEEFKNWFDNFETEAPLPVLPKKASTPTTSTSTTWTLRSQQVRPA
jgi:hypothetical protein